MRIIYFHQHFTTLDGSGGTRSLEFARALLARGHQVTMVCGQNSRAGLALPWDEARHWHRGWVEGIDVIALPLPYSNRDGLARRAQIFLSYAWRSLLIAIRHDYDVLFATSTPLTAALPGIGVRLLRWRIPFIFEVRDLWPELPKALGVKNPLLLGGMSLLEWLAYHCADACVGLSPGIVAGIRRRAPLALPVALIPNGCDLTLFTSTKSTELRLPGVVPGDFIAGFTGAHGVANGLELVLDLAVELKRRGRRAIKLVLIGDGNRKDALVERAARERLDNCLFFPVMKKTEIARVTAGFGCGLQVLANVPEFYYGTSPNKFFDYIASGLPVICNYPGWLADLIAKHECGVTVPPGDVRAFADAVCRLADDTATRKRMGVNARRLAEMEFSRDRLAGEFVRLIESMDTHPRRRREGESHDKVVSRAARD